MADYLFACFSSTRDVLLIINIIIIKCIGYEMKFPYNLQFCAVKLRASCRPDYVLRTSNLVDADADADAAPLREHRKFIG